MKVKSLSIILPCFNEAENIGEMVHDVLAFLETQPFMYEIIIVNDGSTDNSKKIIKSLVLSNKKVRAVHHQQNRGYGATLRTGFANASYEWVFFTDSDRQFAIKDISKLFRYSDSYGMIIGFRKNRQDKLIRIINAKIFNLSVRLLFNLHVKDIDCAFKLLKREIAVASSIESNGALINTELLINARKSGYKIKEVGVSHYPRMKGKATGGNVSVIIKAIKELVSYKLGSRGVFKIYEKLS